MSSLAYAGASAAVLGALIWVQRHGAARRIALRRIPAAPVPEAVWTMPIGNLRHAWEAVLPWVVGVCVFVVFVTLTAMNAFFSAAAGFLAFILTWLLTSMWVSRRTLAVEVQLAEAIDHMVTSLHAGVGVLDALHTAEQNARRHLKPTLSALVSRIRLGDDPVAVCKDLARALPLESFRLFFYALAVQWEGGGNLAPTLATTGRFIRDRVEVGRRVRAHTSEARFSVIAIIMLTYFLALLMWHLGRERMEGFLGTDIGQTAAGIAIVLQALGAAWIARLSRIRF